MSWNLTKTVNAELNNPTVAASVVSPAVIDRVKSVVANTIDVPYRMSGEDQDVLQSLYNNSLTFVPQKDSDHGILKFITERHEEEIMRAIKKQQPEALLLIGSTFRQHHQMRRRLPAAQILSIFGDQDARDRARLVDDILAAKKLLKAKPIKEYDQAKLATEFLSWVDGKPAPSFVTSRDFRERTFNADQAVALNSLYDISPEELHCYMWHFGVRKVWATMILCPELKYAAEVYNPILNVLWASRVSPFTAVATMRYVHSANSGASNGYVHNLENFNLWNWHSFFRFPCFNILTEIVSDRGGAVLMTLHRADRNNWHMIRAVPSTVHRLVRIFDPNKYLRYRRFVYYFVERDKYDRLLMYCIRLAVNTFEPSRILAYLASLMSKIVVGDMTIQRSWQVDTKLALIVAKFAIMEAALERGEIYQMLSEAVDRSKRGGERDWAWTSFWNRFRDYIHNHLLIKKEIAKCKAFCPEEIYEKFYDFSLWAHEQRPLPLIPEGDPFAAVRQPAYGPHVVTGQRWVYFGDDSEWPLWAAKQGAVVLVVNSKESLPLIAARIRQVRWDTLPEISCTANFFIHEPSEEHWLDALSAQIKVQAAASQFYSIGFELQPKHEPLLSLNYEHVVYDEALAWLAAKPLKPLQKVQGYVVADFEPVIRIPAEAEPKQAPAVPDAPESTHDDAALDSAPELPVPSAPPISASTSVDSSSTHSSGKEEEDGLPFFEGPQDKGLRCPPDALFDYVKQYLNNTYAGTESGGDYDGLLKEVKHCCTKLIQRGPIDPSSIDVVVWNMVAGAGKTTRILRDFDPTCHLYIVGTAAMRAEFAEKAAAKFNMEVSAFPARTFDRGLVDAGPQHRKIFIDEAFMQPMAYFATLFHKCPSAQFVLVGDMDQTGYLDSYGYLVSGQKMSTHLLKFTRIEQSRETFRFGPEVCALLKQFDYPAVPKGTRQTKVTRSQAYGLKPCWIQDAYNVCFSDNTLQVLKAMNISAVTVKRAQGVSKPFVNVWVAEGDVGMLRQRDLAIVSLSRAEDHLNIVEMNPKVVAKAGWNVDQVALMTEHFFAPVAPVNFTFTSAPLEAPFSEPIRQVAAFSLATLQRFASPKGAPENLKEAFTVQADRPNRKFVLNMDRMNELRDRAEAYICQTAYGKKFRVASAKQTVFTSIMRVARNKLGTHSYTVDPYWLKTNLALIVPSIKLEELNTLLYKNVLAVTKKYAQKGSLPSMEPTLENAQIYIREHLKQIDKIKDVDAAFQNKGGQSIKAWSLDLNAAFCAYFRSVEELLVSNLGDRFLYANGLSDDDLESKLAMVRGWVTALCNDWTEYDAAQNSATQQMERVAFDWLLNNKSLDLYFAIRKACTIHGTFAVYQNGTTKTSGEPCTLMGNTLLNILLLLMIVPLERVVCMVVKGDDSIVFLNSAESLQLKFSALRKHITIDAKHAFTKVPEFCSMIYAGGKLFYNYQTLARKILSRAYSDSRTDGGSRELLDRDLVALKEYQTAVEDKLRPWRRDPKRVEAGLSAFLAREGLTPTLVESGMEQIAAFAKCSFVELANELTKVYIEL